MLALALSVGDASQLVVGAGTGALALVTWKLARRTKEEVELARRIVATRESIEALDMPFLVASFDLGYPNVDLSPVFEGDSEKPVDAEWTVGMKVENVDEVQRFSSVQLPSLTAWNTSRKSAGQSRLPSSLKRLGSFRCAPPWTPTRAAICA